MSEEEKIKEKEKVKIIKDYQNDAKISDSFRIILLIIGIVSFSALFFYYRGLYIEKGYSKQCDDNNPTNKVDLEQNEISVNDPEIIKYNELIGYETNDMSNLSSIYKGATVNTASLDIIHKKTISLLYFMRNSSINGTEVACSDLDIVGLDFTCNSENIALMNGTAIKKFTVSNNDFNSTYKDIFGPSSAIDTEGFTTANNIKCTYLAGEYNCLNMSGVPVGIETVSYNTKAFKYDDRIEIFTKYVWLENNVGYSNLSKEKEYFNNYQVKEGLSTINNIKNNYNDKIDTYKFTFNKTNDGIYYWEKIELVQ